MLFRSNSVVRNVNKVTVVSNVVLLTLASPVSFGDVVTLSYTKPATNPLQTASGGQAASIGTQPVTNKIAPPLPVYLSSSIENLTPARLDMTYNMNLANIAPVASSFSVRVNSIARTVNSVAISGTKVFLTLASQVTSGDLVTVAYTKPAANPLQTIAGGQAITISAQSVTNRVSPSIPAYVSSSIENATPARLDISFNMTLANIVPLASAFTVLVNSAVRTVTAVAVSGTRVLLTLASPVTYNQTVTVAYTRPATNPIQSTSEIGRASWGERV